jgi:hypothetical protein
MNPQHWLSQYTFTVAFFYFMFCRMCTATAAGRGCGTVPWSTVCGAASVADPDPHQNVMDPQHWLSRYTFTVAFSILCFAGCVLLLRRAGCVVPCHGPLCAVPPVVPRALSGAPPSQHAHPHGKRRSFCIRIHINLHLFCVARRGSVCPWIWTKVFILLIAL